MLTKSVKPLTIKVAKSGIGRSPVLYFLVVDENADAIAKQSVDIDADVELGTRADVDGNWVGLRFYKIEVDKIFLKRDKKQQWLRIH